MAERDPSESSGNQFCGNCGSAVAPGAVACVQCGAAIQPEHDSPELGGDYIPYCRSCGVPVAREAAFHCTKCGVSPLCREHYYPSTRSCALCPSTESAGPDEQDSAISSSRPDGP